jgi:hypothetical protein
MNQERSKWTGGRFCFTKSWIRISTSGTKRTKAQLEGKSVVGFDADLKLDAERSNYSEDAPAPR